MKTLLLRRFVTIALLVLAAGAGAAWGENTHGMGTVPAAVLVPRDTSWVKDLILLIVWGVLIPAVVFGPVIKYFSTGPKAERRAR